MAAKTQTMQAVSLPMELIDDDPRNVRTQIGDVTDLRRSMDAEGLLQPIIVYPTGAGRFTAWAGHRRRKAARELGWTHIDAVIRDAPPDNVTRIILQLTENGQRKDLNFIEEAKAYAQLVDEGLTQLAISKRVGKSDATISTRLDLLDWLDADEQTLVANKQMSLDTAKQLIYNRKNDRHVGRSDIGEARPTSGPTVSWFTRAHPLAIAAGARCLKESHDPLLRFGGACGRCWEAEIRRDERLHMPTAAAAAKPGSREATEARMRCQRCEANGAARHEPCRPAGGGTYATHDYELVAARTVGA